MRKKINVYVDDAVNPKVGTYGSYKDQSGAEAALITNGWKLFLPISGGYTKKADGHNLVAYIVDCIDDMQPPEELP